MTKQASVPPRPSQELLDEELCRVVGRWCGFGRRGPSIGKVRRLLDLPSECGSQLGPSSRSQKLEDSHRHRTFPVFFGVGESAMMATDHLFPKGAATMRRPTNDREQA